MEGDGYKQFRVTASCWHQREGEAGWEWHDEKKRQRCLWVFAGLKIYKNDENLKVKFKSVPQHCNIVDCQKHNKQTKHIKLGLFDANVFLKKKIQYIVFSFKNLARIRNFFLRSQPVSSPATKLCYFRSAQPKTYRQALMYKIRRLP